MTTGLLVAAAAAGDVAAKPAATLQTLPAELHPFMRITWLRSPELASMLDFDIRRDRRESIFRSATPTEADDSVSTRIGGIVSLSTRSGQDYDQLFASIKGRAVVNDLFTDKVSVHNRLRLALPFGVADRFGAFFYSRQQRRHFGYHGSKGEWAADAAGGPAFLDEFEIRRAQVDRERYDFGVNLDWRPQRNTHLYLRYLYLHSRDLERRDGMEYDIDWDAAPLDSIWQDRVVADDTVVAAMLRPGQGRLERKLKDELELNRRHGLDVGIEHRNPDDWHFSAKLRFARRNMREPDRLNTEFQYRRFGAVAGVSGFGYELGGSGITLFNPDPQTGVDNFDPANFQLRRVEAEDNQRIWDYREAGAQLSTPMRTTHGIVLRGGFHYQRRYQRWDDDYQRLEPRSPASLPLTDFRGDAIDSIAGQAFGISIDPATARALELADRAQFRLLQLESAFKSLAQDFQGTESVYSVFALARSHRAGPWDWSIGARFEHAETDTRARHLEWSGDEMTGNPFLDTFAGINVNQPTHSRVRQTAALPWLQMRYQPVAHQIITMSYSRAVQRPRIEDRLPRMIADADRGRERKRIMGNPLLANDHIDQFQISMDRHLQRVGYLRLAVFYHHHSSPPVLHAAITPWRASFEAAERPWLTHTAINASTAHAHGFRLNWYQRLQLLPAPLDGLGLLANYQFHPSSQRLHTLNDNKRVTMLADQPRHDANAGVFYTRDRWFGYLIAHWHSRYLDAVGDTASGARGSGDLWIAPRWNVQLQLEYQLSHAAEVFVEIRNLTDTRYVIYEGNPQRTVESIRRGREFRTGMQLKF